MTYQLSGSAGDWMLLVLLLAIGLLALVFWIWMIIDCVGYETDGTTKIAWLLIILLAGIIGAPLYYLFRKAPRDRIAQFHRRSRYRIVSRDQKDRGTK